MTIIDTQRTTIPHRTATTLLSLVIPATIVTVATAVVWSWRDVMPNPVAIHWGTSQPNGFGAFGPQVLVPAGVCLVATLAMWAIGYFAGRDSITRRSVAGISVWFSTMLTVVTVGTMAPQRGLANAADMGSVNGVIVLSFCLATVGAVAAAWATPGDPPQPTRAPIPLDAVRLKLRDGEKVAWVEEVGKETFRVVVIGAILFATLFGFLSRLWLVGLAIALFFGVIVASFLRWTVTVDSNGLTARSVLRRPRIRVPLDEVEKADVIDVHPLRQYGGYGIRGGAGGRVGVIIRKGEAIEVYRTGGRIFVVTVHDAATGAALLNSLAAQARG